MAGFLNYEQPLFIIEGTHNYFSIEEMEEIFNDVDTHETFENKCKLSQKVKSFIYRIYDTFENKKFLFCNYYFTKFISNIDIKNFTFTDEFNNKYNNNKLGKRDFESYSLILNSIRTFEKLLDVYTIIRNYRYGDIKDINAFYKCNRANYLQMKYFIDIQIRTLKNFKTFTNFTKNEEIYTLNECLIELFEMFVDMELKEFFNNTIN